MASRTPLPELAISTLVFDSRGRLWIGTESGGAYCLNPASGGFVRLYTESGADYTVSSLVEDRAGVLWVGTLHHGLYWYDIKRKHRPEALLYKVDHYVDAGGISSIL